MLLFKMGKRSKKTTATAKAKSRRESTQKK